MAIEIFNRHEIKYLVDIKIQQKLIQELLIHMTPDIHNEDSVYQISNIYCDTTNDDIITHSLSKPRYKEKLRIRGYGNINLDSIVYFEIKKKYNGIVNKRRSKIVLREAYKFIETKQLPMIQDYMNVQVLKEIQYLLTYYDLKPKIFMSYQRVAFFGKENPDLRISFDNKALTRRNDLELEKGCYGRSLLGDDLHIMEIKVQHAIPLWLVEILSKYELVPASFSKYGTEYRQNILKIEGDLIYV